MTGNNKTEKKGLFENSTERTFLTPTDHEAFFSALDNPPEPTKAPRVAFKQYEKRASGAMVIGGRLFEHQSRKGNPQ